MFTLVLFCSQESWRKCPLSEEHHLWRLFSGSQLTWPNKSLNPGLFYVRNPGVDIPGRLNEVPRFLVQVRGDGLRTVWSTHITSDPECARISVSWSSLLRTLKQPIGALESALAARNKYSRGAEKCRGRKRHLWKPIFRMFFVTSCSAAIPFCTWLDKDGERRNHN